MFAEVVTSLLFLTVLTEVHQIESNKVPTSSRSSKITERSLPDGNADWMAIRANNSLYVDKTLYLMKLLKRGGKLWFLTRPPSFGKSMFVDMMADFFRGEEEKFKGLAIGNVGNTKYCAGFIRKTREHLPKWMTFPVIHLKFTGLTNFHTEEDLDRMYHEQLRDIAINYNINDFDDISISRLIWMLKRKFNQLYVFVLVDDYDYPFHYALLKLKNRKLAECVTDYLDTIFTNIKGNIADLGLAFVTGVSKLDLLKLESSGFNAFVDLTFDNDFAGAFGVSEDEITANMDLHLRKFAHNTSTTQEVEKVYDDAKSSEKEILKKLRDWYGGYQFSVNNDACKVLNPVSTFESLKNQKFCSYRTRTSSMYCLMHLFYEQRSSLDMLKIGFSIVGRQYFNFLKTDIRLSIWMLLFGYLTISNYDKKKHAITLKFPNKEIVEAVEYNLAMYVPNKKGFIDQDFPKELKLFKNAMETGNTKVAMEVLSSFRFQSYTDPYNKDIRLGEVERRLELFFRAAAINIQQASKFNKDSEPKHSEGDVDIQTTNLDINYIVKIKCTGMKDDTALSAIKQLLRYTINYPKSFINVTGNQDNYYLLALNFLFQEGSAPLLNSWIVLPWVNGTLQYSDVEAQPEDLKVKFLRDMKPE